MGGGKRPGFGACRFIIKKLILVGRIFRLMRARKPVDSLFWLKLYSNL